ncbi:MAG: acyltransferase [Rhodospirillaceae bacterium]|nr:MAG: acyltransferase [Rhodospirillaceae bacterium]
MLPRGQTHAFGQGLIFPHPSRVTDPAQLDAFRALGLPVWNRFLALSSIDPSVILGPEAWIENLSGNPRRVTIGDHCALRGMIRIEPTGTLAIGHHVYIGDETLISVNTGIIIGNDVAIAHGVQIFDNASHPIDWQERQKHTRGILMGTGSDATFPGRPVIIGDNCWLGTMSIVRAGVTIGARSIVSAMSFVAEDVPADVIVAGNPAQVIKRLA